MTLSKAEQIEALKKKKAELDARISTLRSQRVQEDRKLDTRRKILAGAVVLEHCDHDADFKAAIGRLLDRFLTRPQDRSLFADVFGLSELAPTTAEGIAAAVAAGGGD